MYIYEEIGYTDFMISNAQDQMLTDHCGNSYPASRLEGPDTPDFDVEGARRDQAWKALGSMSVNMYNARGHVGDTVKILKTFRKNKAANGQLGQVFWEGPDKFYVGSRYRTDMQACMSAALGFGTILGVQLKDGSKVFVAAPIDGDYELVHRETAEELRAREKAKQQAAEARRLFHRNRIQEDLTRFAREIAASKK